MKKIVTLILIIFVSLEIYGYPNPIVNRLSKEEIVECKTPASVAYNFINAILSKDFTKARLFMTPWLSDGFTDENIKRELANDGIYSLIDFFSLPNGKYSVLTWRPALENGWEIVVGYVQERGNNELAVYVLCCPTSEIGQVGFQDITRYGSPNIKVKVIKIGDEWKIDGFY